MYTVQVYCEFHGWSFAPADDASCPICDEANEIMFDQYDLENNHPQDAHPTHHAQNDQP